MGKSKDFAKILEGLKAAESMLNHIITPEILEKMTPEQLKEFETAKNEIDTSAIQKEVEKLEKYTKNI